LALSEADDLAVGRGDDDLARGDGRGGSHGRGGFVFPDFLAAGEIEPVEAAVVGADESLLVNVPMTESLERKTVAQWTHFGSNTTQSLRFDLRSG
jgi:hypothetical protein